MPARLVCNARQLRLRLAHGMFHKQEFWALHRHILNLAPPDSLATAHGDRPLRLPEVQRDLRAPPMFFSVPATPEPIEGENHEGRHHRQRPRGGAGLGDHECHADEQANDSQLRLQKHLEAIASQDGARIQHRLAIVVGEREQGHGTRESGSKGGVPPGLLGRDEGGGVAQSYCLIGDKTEDAAERQTGRQ